MPAIDVLVVVQRKDASRYHKNLSVHSEFKVRLVSDPSDALDTLADRDHHVDVLVLDNNLDGVFDLVRELRHTYPRLLILLVDEEADFAMPGQADDISTEPFENDDLVRRINRLMSDRSLETLRADAMPPVREFAKILRKAAGEMGKQEAAVSACLDLGYDYVALYKIENPNPLQVTLRAQQGPKPIQAVAPKEAAADDIIGWVAKTGQSRIAAPEDDLNHPLVRKGRLGAVACVPIGAANRYGVLVACRDEPGTITQQNVLMLELISAQLAAVITKET
ncbi:MAG: GAF domain-containing protein [Chloroflexi bacterium]|nr:GAF domain-containing protein [Chloroflexota bacterium]